MIAIGCCFTDQLPESIFHNKTHNIKSFLSLSPSPLLLLFVFFISILCCYFSFTLDWNRRNLYALQTAQIILCPKDLFADWTDDRWEDGSMRVGIGIRCYARKTIRSLTDRQDDCPWRQSTSSRYLAVQRNRTFFERAITSITFLRTVL